MAAPRAGRPMLYAGARASARWHRRAIGVGTSVLAISAGLAAGAAAQTVVGPGQTVTNTGSNTGGYALTGSGGTLINPGLISTNGTVAVSAEVEPFSPGDLTTYRILGITVNNSGQIASTNANALTAISVDGFTWSNAGTITTGNSAASSTLPTVYLNNVNNLQLTNNGTVQLTGASTDARLLTAFKLTNSTIINTGLMSSQGAGANGAPLIFLSGDSNNVTLTNGGTIASTGRGEAILIGNDGTAAITTTIDGTHVFTVNPSATNITLNNSSMISSPGRGVAIGGTSSAVILNNSGTIAAAGNAVAVQDAASNVAIANSGLIATSGSAAAIGVSSSGTGLSIDNSGTITAPVLAIDHGAGTTPLAISNSGIINGGIQLSQPGDTVSITGGAINGAITTVNGGAGSVVFNAAGGFNTGGDFGSAGAPLGGITVAGGSVNVGNALIANVVTFGGGTATLAGNVNAVASGGTLNFAGGSVNLGTSTLTLGANATIRTSTANGSSIGVTISPTQNGLINARAGNATVDTSANTLVIRPNLVGGVFPKTGTEYVVIATSTGANVSNALTKLSVAPGDNGLFSVGTATTATDGYGKPLTIGKDIVLITTGSAGSEGNAAIASSNTQIERAQTNVIVSSVSNHLDNILSGVIGTPPGGGTSGGDEEGPTWSIWQDTSGSVLQNGALGSSYRGTIWTGLAGADRPIGDKFIVGAVVGGEGNSFDLTSTGSKRSGTGISITPYGAYIINDWSALDFEASYAFLDNDVTVPQGNASVTNHYMSNRVFVAGNASAYTNVDAFTLRVKFGMLWADNSGPRYTDANGVSSKPPNTVLTQAKLGGEVTYHYEQFEPFVDLTAAQDLTGSGSLNTAFGPALTGTSAKFGLQYDAGLRYKTEGGSSFGLQVGGETLRAHQSSFIAGVFARVPL